MLLKSNIIYKTLAATLLALTLWSCADEPAAPEPVGRSVLVYMAADNSLGGSSGCDARDIYEMRIAAQAGALSGGRLIIYHDPSGRDPVMVEICASRVDTLFHYNSDVTSVASERMLQVMSDFKRVAPAERYGLVLWSHGSGWIENGIEDPIVDEISAPSKFSTQSFGDDRGKKMNVTTLAKVLERQSFDYVYFDCCYMAGIEVAYQLRNATPRMVGSATELPADGMPYDLTLKWLMAYDAEPQTAAATTFDYYDSFTGDRRTCTISYIETAGLELLAEETAAIYATHRRLPDGFKPQQYMTSSCYLFDFRQYVNALCADEGGAPESWNEAFDAVVRYKAQTPYLWGYISLAEHSGLSTYILPEPSKSEWRGYDTLDWWKAAAHKLID